MIFELPWAFAFVPVSLLVLIFMITGRHRQKGIPFSSSFPVSIGITSVRQRMLWLPPLLFFTGSLFYYCSGGTAERAAG